MPLKIRSTAFADGQKIPVRYVRDGDNVSPPLQWAGAPANTRSYALVVEDPDAPKGTFRHWAVYDIPADKDSLEEDCGAMRGHSAASGEVVRTAANDFGNRSYDGPQPPPGHGTHHYHFRLFALDVPHLDVPAGAHAGNLAQLARDHALAEAEVVGTFER
jgi:Raf kinase inhibitor-like YbhB/YbcL family protein